jgi:hypothetical protein
MLSANTVAQNPGGRRKPALSPGHERLFDCAKAGELATQAPNATQIIKRLIEQDMRELPKDAARCNDNMTAGSQAA